MTATLTPVVLVRDGAGLNVTTALAAAADTSLEFTNSGREILAVSTTGTAVTVQVNIGSTVLGQDVTPFPAVTLTSGDIYLFGPFDRAVDGANSTVTVTLSTDTAVSVALLQDPGTF